MRTREAGGHAECVLWLFLAVAAFLLLQAAAARSAAAGEPEQESNDTPETATVLYAGHYGTGTSSGSNDTDFWLLTPPSSGRVHLTFGTNTTGGFCLALNMTDPHGLPINSNSYNTTAHEATYKFETPGNASVLIELCHTVSPFDYHLSFTFEGSGYYFPCGRADEWTGAPWSAAEVKLGYLEHGCADAEYRDVHYWNLSSPRDEWAAVVVTSVGSANASLEGPPTGLETAPSGQPFVLFVHLVPGAATYLRVESDVGTAEYWFRVEVAPTLAGLRAGSGEAEPNDSPAAPQQLLVNGTYEGVLDQGYDPQDWFLVRAPAGAIVNVTLANAYGLLPVEVLPGWPLSPFANVDRGGGYGHPSEYSAILVARNETPLMFGLRATGPHIPYNFTLTVTPAPELAERPIRLSVLQEFSQLDVEVLAPPWRTLTQLFYMFDNGEGVIYGETLCASTVLTVPLEGVRVDAGETFTPDNPLLVPFVSTRQASLRLEGSLPSCFRAMALTDSGYVPESYSAYRPGGPLTGDAASVVAEMNRSGRDSASGLIALWAVTVNLTQADLSPRFVTYSQTVEAIDILDSAGVLTELNAPPQEERGSPTSGWLVGYWPQLFLVALLLAPAAYAAVRLRARTTRTAMGRWLGSRDLPPALTPQPAPACPGCGAPAPPGGAACSWCGRPL